MSKEIHPSIFEDLKEICEDAFTGIWLGSTATNTEEDYWSDFEAIEQGLAVLDTMRALFGDDIVADAIEEGRQDFIDNERAEMEREDSCYGCEEDDCCCDCLNNPDGDLSLDSPVIITPGTDPNNDPDLDIDFSNLEVTRER